jgi:CheY-like chemotaxis protein
MLRDAGYSTIQAVDGQDALRQLRGADPKVDLIVSDVVMPHVTGTELVVRMQEVRPDLPVVLTSGYSAADLRARGLEHYPGPLLTKPYTQGELVAMVDRLLGVDSRSKAG